MRVPTSLTPLYLAAHSTLQPRTEPDTPAHICIRIHAHTVLDTPAHICTRIHTHHTDTFTDTTSRCPAPLSKRRSLRMVSIVLRMAELALKISSRKAIEAVGKNPVVQRRYSSCYERHIRYKRETPPSHRRSRPSAEARRVGAAHTRMHDLLEGPQREWPKDFLRSREACEQTLEKGPAAQMREALPQS